MDILELSSRTIDSGTITEPTNRVTNELTELADGLALVESFSHSAVLDTAKKNMSEDEWAFWMEGKPAKGDIKDPKGKLMEKAGTVRDGGSFDERMGAVACWNAVMDEDRYMVQKWNQFIAA